MTFLAFYLMVMIFTWLVPGWSLGQFSLTWDELSAHKEMTPESNALTRLIYSFCWPIWAILTIAKVFA